VEKIRLKNLYRNLRSKYPSVTDGDFKYIFAKVFGSFNKVFLENPVVGKSEAEKVEAIIKRYLEDTPLEYIFEVAEFFGFEFKIKKGIHIPKNATEILVERVLAFADEKTKIIDIGCGCGNVAIVIAKLANAEVWAVDIDERALKITKENAKKHGVKVKIVKSNVFDAVFEKFDIIVSNPPYVSTKEELEKSVLMQNSASLFAGSEGLDVIKKIVEQAPLHLNKGGRIFLEIGYDQSQKVSEMLFRNGFKNVKIHKDLSDVPRIAEAEI